jgi:hypothetical protein
VPAPPPGVLAFQAVQTFLPQGGCGTAGLGQLGVRVNGLGLPSPLPPGRRERRPLTMSTVAVTFCRVMYSGPL